MVNFFVYLKLLFFILLLLYRHLSAKKVVIDILAKIAFLHQRVSMVKIHYLEKYYTWILSKSRVIPNF